MSEIIKNRKPKSKPNRGDATTSRLVTFEQFEKYTNMGRTKAREYAYSIGAVITMGERLKRVDLAVVDADLDKRHRAVGATETA